MSDWDDEWEGTAPTELDDIDVNPVDDLDTDEIYTGEDETDETDSGSDDVDDEYSDISDDDIVVVMEDGSYIIIPYTTFSTLLQDEDFGNQIDEGFTDINQFQSITSKLLG